MHPAATLTVVAVGAILAGLLYLFVNTPEDHEERREYQQRRPPPGPRQPPPKNQSGTSFRNRQQQPPPQEGFKGDCPICLEQCKDNEKSVMLPCRHRMHHTCYQRAFQHGQTSCPICRAQM